jgi:hypothetical protein
MSTLERTYARECARRENLLLCGPAEDEDEDDEEFDSFDPDDMRDGWGDE